MDNMHKTGRISDTEMLEAHYKGKVTDKKMKGILEIMSMIRKRRGISIEEIAAETGYGYGNTSDIIGILEIDGFVSIDLLQRCTANIKKI